MDRRILGMMNYRKILKISHPFIGNIYLKPLQIFTLFPVTTFTQVFSGLRLIDAFNFYLQQADISSLYIYKDNGSSKQQYIYCYICSLLFYSKM